MNSINASNSRDFLPLPFVFIVLLLLNTACGGGGGEQVQPLRADIVLPEIDRSIKAGETVYFDGNADGGRPPYQYHWRFGVGIPDAAARTPGNVTFAFEGSYNVSFSVTDADQKTASDTVIIEVEKNELTQG